MKFLKVSSVYYEMSAYYCNYVMIKFTYINVRCIDVVVLTFRKVGERHQ